MDKSIIIILISFILYNICQIDGFDQKGYCYIYELENSEK